MGIANVTSSIGDMMKRLGAVGAVLGIGGGGIVAGVLGLARSVADLSGELDSLARRAGVSVETLQELKFAASTRGVSFDGLVDGLKELNLRADEFIATGKGPAADAFAALGYSASELKGKLKDPAALFAEIIERLGALDKSTQIRFTDEIFGGTGGEQFAQMIGMTADELKRLMATARDTGAVLGNDVVEAGRKFIINLDLLMMRLDGLRKRIGAQLLPTLNDLVVDMTAWLDVNKGLVRSAIVEWTGKLIKVVKDLRDPTSEVRRQIAGLKAQFDEVMASIKPFVDFVGGPMNAALGALALWIGAPLLTALSVVSLAFINLGIAIMTTPIGWILAGIAALGAAVYVLIQRWDDFAAYWSGLWGRVTSAFNDGFVNGIMAALTEFNPGVHVLRGINEVVKYLTGVDLGSAAAEMLRPVTDAVRDTFSGLAASVGDHIGEVINAISFKATVFYQVGREMVLQLWDGIKSMWSDLQTWFATKVQDLVGWLPDAVKAKLGLGVLPGAGGGKDGGDGSAMPATMGLPSTVGAAGRIELPTIGAPSIVPAGPPLDVKDYIVSPSRATAPPAGGDGGEVRTNAVNADTVSAQNLTLPDPLVVHEPQAIDASLHIGSIVVQGGAGTPGEIEGAVRSALAKQAAEQRRNALSELAD